MDMTTGTYGAKVQSWKKANPRDLLKRLMEENRSAEKPALLALLRDELLREDGLEYLESVIEYWFANNYHSLTDRQPTVPREVVKAERTKKVDAVKSVVTAKIRQVAEIMLLDMVTLPSGKALRDSTGKECAKAGGWLSALAKRVQPNQKIGAVLSEADVRKVFKAAS